MIIRPTIIYHRDELGCDIEFPELVNIQFRESVAAPFDLGALAYANRCIPANRKVSSRKLDPVKVLASTLREERIKLIRNIVDEVFITPNSDLTVYLRLSKYRLVIDWCDSHNCSNIFLDPDSARMCYLQYITDLRHRIYTQLTLGPVRGAAYQSAMKDLIVLNFGSAMGQSIVAGISAIRHDRHSVGEIPQEKYVREHTQILRDITIKLSRELMNTTPFPFKLTIGSSETCFLPYITGSMSTEKKPNAVRAIDNDSCQIRSIKELTSKFGMQRSEALNCLKGVRRTLKDANTNSRCRVRRQLISLVLNCYASLFIFITGASAAELVQFQYDDAVLVTETTLRKQLKAIKLRARGKVTKYTIGRKTGLAILKEYLDFRAWALNSEHSDFLFLGFNHGLNAIAPLNPKFSNVLIDRLKSYYFAVNTPHITPKLARKIKSVVLHQLANDPDVVADVLNHTTDINLRNYSHPTLDGQRQEFQNYWASVRKIINVIRDKGEEKATSIAAGHCNHLNHPAPIDSLIPITPVCESQLGCLYCEHYSCHADEEDVFKLLSIQFVVETLRNAAISRSHTDQLFKDLNCRLIELISCIADRSLDSLNLVATLQHRVFGLGILTPFWEARLQRYEEMGII